MNTELDQIFSTLSVVIPTLNEEKTLPDTLNAIRELSVEGAEIVVIDGGSHDSTRSIAKDRGAYVSRVDPSRGDQLRVGAERSTRAYLLFIHADSILSTEAKSSLRRELQNAELDAGFFCLKFDAVGPMFTLFEILAKMDSAVTSFGDQGLLVKRSIYLKAGGYPSWPLFEDVELLRRVRRIAKIKRLAGSIQTSARRFRSNGPIRTQIKNVYLLLLFFVGVSPTKLATKYYPD